jgi:hypothetical protein
MRPSIVPLGILIVAVLSYPVAAQPPAPGGLETRPAGERSLALVKALSGDWVQAADKDKPDGPATNSFRVTACGSAVIESMTPKGEDEMVTVSFDDGKDLALTHYCSLGNRPAMRVNARSAGGRTLDFERIAGTCPKDAHMHGLKVQFLKGDRLKTEWKRIRDGKVVEVCVFELVRRKPARE